MNRTWVVRGLIAAAVLAGGFLLWTVLKPSGLPTGIVGSNGRLEAIEVDVASKSPGRIDEILVDQGDTVKAGQIVARMDVDVLNAQKAEVEAQLAEAQNAVVVAQGQVAQREAEKAASEAVVRQRLAELNASRKRLGRSETLASEGATSVQERDDYAAQTEGASAAAEAARAQVASARVAITNARNQVIGAQSRVAAVRATLQRIEADINDAALRSPRDGRVQYRIAQPGEVVSAGGRVVSLIDLTDVTMSFFLPAGEAGKLRMGSEARIVLDALPDYPIPASISFVADVAQFTPKTVETQSEREKMMFRVKARIAPELLRRRLDLVKTGLPGMAYVRLDPSVEWPQWLQVKPFPSGQAQTAP
ncbi:HlyD family secretion protein [Novosphingobium mangrovi (ex Huang et al. 2023)]|uniref:HlyD family efflux transporter periplasmic adaptor subunit n=1 Tax=Novosphingobium mangrovi (ex Huang et al. 2023) TaxID=2976432 RepID=A0ABT2I1Q7_9SPHN|nr:HlyD family efflux transporter periplasmic adaptor subunit [Novosphingobium mangrovi (ex Huang et al. 2023)]MCT2398747.1 HlyD family efflux transporter periplasmic adaptor subunit [Novosphingobium mangrovi (ex Huang et al. 2023)]